MLVQTDAMPEPEPVVIERIVERVVERVIEVEVAASFDETKRSMVRWLAVGVAPNHAAEPSSLSSHHRGYLSGGSRGAALFVIFPMQ